jgi:hypothetical protein
MRAKKFARRKKKIWPESRLEESHVFGTNMRERHLNPPHKDVERSCHGREEGNNERNNSGSVTRNASNAQRFVRSLTRAAISFASSSTMRVATPSTIATSARLKSGRAFEVVGPT